MTSNPADHLHDHAHSDEPTSFEHQRLEALREHATAQGGRCLSTRIREKGQLVEFECGGRPEPHRWFASQTGVLQTKAWCPVCAKARVRSAKK